MRPIDLLGVSLLCSVLTLKERTREDSIDVAAYEAHECGVCFFEAASCNSKGPFGNHVGGGGAVREFNGRRRQRNRLVL